MSRTPLSSTLTRQDSYPVPEPPAEVLDPAADLVGRIFDVPDAHWGFENAASTQHPGACTHYHPGQQRGVVLRGTDADNVRPDLHWRFYFVAPDGRNGLEVLTGFECAPRYFRRHRLRLLLAGRERGRLSEEDLQALRERLRVFGL